MPALTRRRFAGTLALAAAGCAGTPAAGRALEVARGVWVVPGAVGAADEQNLGRIGNAGFVVGPAGVVAIDTPIYLFN